MSIQQTTLAEADSVSLWEHSASLFTVQHNKDNDVRWGKGQTLLTIVNILNTEDAQLGYKLTRYAAST